MISWQNRQVYGAYSPDFPVSRCMKNRCRNQAGEEPGKDRRGRWRLHAGLRCEAMGGFSVSTLAVSLSEYKQNNSRQGREPSAAAASQFEEPCPRMPLHPASDLPYVCRFCKFDASFVLWLKPSSFPLSSRDALNGRQGPHPPFHSLH